MLMLRCLLDSVTSLSVERNVDNCSAVRWRCDVYWREICLHQH